MKRILLAVIILAFGLAACGAEPETAVFPAPIDLAPPPLPTLDTTAVSLGEQVYAQNCASCHGAELEGEADWKGQNEDDSFRAPPHSADGHTWHHPDSQLLNAIAKGGARLPAEVGGASNMPAYAETLTLEEQTAVLTYIKSTWPDDIRQLQWEQTVRQDGVPQS